MEKKLKINFILKGIAVFAFVAFCLLAILAGVTLPFVSNASSSDSAIASAESDYAIASADNTINYDNFTTTLSNCNTTNTYYGFYITEEFYNFVSNYNFGEASIFFGNCSFGDNSFMIFCGPILKSDYSLNFKCFAYMFSGNNNYMLRSDIPYSATNRAIIFNQGFTFSSIYSGNDDFKDKIKVFTILPLAGDTADLQNQIAILTSEKNALQTQVNTLTAEKATLQSQLTEKQNQIDTLTAEKATLQSQLTEKQNQIDTLTAEKATLQSQVNSLTSDKESLQAQLTEKQNQIDTLTSEKNALQTQVNNLTEQNNDLEDRLGFNSEFGFIGNLRSNRIYFNLKFAPKIPSDKLCPYGENAIINGYYKQGNDFYLPVLVAYDSSGKEVTAGFTGWKFTCVLNPDGSPTTSFRLDFFVDNLAVYHIDSVELNGKCFTTPDYSHGYAIVGADYVGSGISVYTSPKSQYFYDLKPNYFRQSQVRNFLAFFHYLTYEPVDDAFYLAGLNAASKGYFDDGYNKGYSDGEDVGYNSGFSAGDAQGFARGVESANTYSFLGLFGAIFDAPIKAIFGGTSTLPAGTTITDSNGNTITLQSTTTVNRAGLLNFNLMGVNLSGFVLAMFSISIIVVVIKFALAKK